MGMGIHTTIGFGFNVTKLSLKSDDDEVIYDEGSIWARINGAESERYEFCKDNPPPAQSCSSSWSDCDDAEYFWLVPSSTKTAYDCDSISMGRTIEQPSDEEIANLRDFIEQVFDGDIPEPQWHVATEYSY
jgi:hypothetical protein